MDLLNSMCSSRAGETDDRQELVAGRIPHFRGVRPCLDGKRLKKILHTTCYIESLTHVWNIKYR
jgi:hypothetical protein